MRTFKEYLTEKSRLDIQKFKSDPNTWEEQYTETMFSKDMAKLLEEYSDKFKPNEKLLATLTIDEEIEKEKNKLKHIILKAFNESPWEHAAGKLWSITKIVANNGKDPNISFVGNADQRWNNIFKKLGHM